MNPGYGLLSIMFMVMIFLAAVAMISPIKEQVSFARSELSCESEDLSVSDSATCIINDFYLPFFFGTAVLGGLTYMGFKKSGGS